MSHGSIVDDEQRPLGMRIAEFPLVTMMLAIFLMLATAGLTGGLLEVAFALGGSAVPKWLSSTLVAAVMVLVYKASIRHMGLRHHDDLAGRGAVRQLGLGILIGFVLFSTIVAVATLAGTYSISGAGDSSNLPSALINEGMFPAVSEELLFRAILFRWLEEFAGSWVALIISSALFGAAHLWNPNASWIAAAAIAAEAGLMLGAAYMLTRKLWLPMGIHGAWNVSQGEIYDIPVSGNPAHGLVDAQLQGPALLTGGGFGLEGSLIAIIIATAFGCWLLWLAIKRGHIVPAMTVRRHKAGD